VKAEISKALNSISFVFTRCGDMFIYSLLSLKDKEIEGYPWEN